MNAGILQAKSMGYVDMSSTGLLCINSIKNETEAPVLVPLGEIRVLLG